MSFWFLLRKYCNFLWKSTNQHGVHSPFVYNIVTKCFYSKKKYFYDKKIRISKEKFLFLNKLYDYFQFETHFFYGSDENYISFLKSKSKLSKENEKTDIIIIDQIAPCIDIEKVYKQMKNDTLLLIIAPYKNNYDFLCKSIDNQYFTVIIDTFDFALFFIRREQLREFFIIRR